MSQLANKQIRLITLLELLPLTRWQEKDKDAYNQINSIAAELALYLQKLAAFTGGKTPQRPHLPENLESQLQHRLQLALVSSSESSLATSATQLHSYDAQQGFALTGYSWLIYQLAIAVEALYEDIAVIDIAYHKPSAAEIKPKQTD